MSINQYTQFQKICITLNRSRNVLLVNNIQHSILDIGHNIRHSTFFFLNLKSPSSEYLQVALE